MKCPMEGAHFAKISRVCVKYEATKGPCGRIPGGGVSARADVVPARPLPREEGSFSARVRNDDSYGRARARLLTRRPGVRRQVAEAFLAR